MFEYIYMTIIGAIAVLILCFYVLTKVVDEYFLKSLDNIAHALKLTPSVAGATLMAVGTSAPELSTAMFALFAKDIYPLIGLESPQDSIAALGIGNVVGSAIFQILVVIGFTAIVKTSYLNWKPVIRDGVFYAITIVQLIIIIQDKAITAIESGSLLITYLIYIIILIWWSRNVKDEIDEPDPIEMIEKDIEERRKKKGEKTVLQAITSPIDFPLSFIPDAEKNKRATVPVFIISLVIIALASFLLVVAAEELAVQMGIPSVIIALTILAGGSSIPELVSSAIVSKQGRGDMAISNAVGSNIFDILISLGLPVFIYTLINGDLTKLGGENVSSSIWLLFVTLIAVLALLISQKFKIGKAFGFFLIGTYVIYVFAAYGGWL